MMNRRPMRDVIKPAIADVDAQVFKIRMREWGYIDVLIDVTSQSRGGN
jgi:hypothetical protein